MQFLNATRADTRPAPCTPALLAYRNDNSPGSGRGAARRQALVCCWILTSATRLECRWQARSEAAPNAPAMAHETLTGQ